MNEAAGRITSEMPWLIKMIAAYGGYLSPDSCQKPGLQCLNLIKHVDIEYIYKAAILLKN